MPEALRIGARGARQRRKPRQEHGVERRLDDKVQRDERLVPIAGDENPLETEMPSFSGRLRTRQDEFVWYLDKEGR